MRLPCERLRHLQLGTCLLAFGSLALLIFQQVSKDLNSSWTHNDDDDAGEEGVGYYNRQATATTGVVLCVSVLILALTTLGIQILMLQRDLHVTTTSSNANLRWSDRSRTMMLAPSLALFLVLIIRLFFGADHFQGEPYFLDFGWKYGLLPHDRSVEENGDDLFNEPAEKNVAFTVEFNSYGHCLQGVLAALLVFPVVSRFLLGRACGCCSSSRYKQIWTDSLAIFPWTMTIYPTYSLLKRIAKARYAFAGSSFSNNAFEWAAGFLFGVAIGDLLTIMAIFWQCSKSDSESNDNSAVYHQASENGIASRKKDTSVLPPWWNIWEGNKQNKSNEELVSTSSSPQETQPNRWITTLQTVFGIILIFTVLTGSGLFGTTWNSCLEGSPDVCVNSTEGSTTAYSIKMTIVFVAIPLVTILAFASGITKSKQEPESNSL